MGEMCSCTSTGFEFANDEPERINACGVMLQDTGVYTGAAKKCDQSSKIQIWATNPNWTMSRNGDNIFKELGLDHLVEYVYRPSEKELFNHLLKLNQARKPWIAHLWEPHEFNFLVDSARIPIQCDKNVNSDANRYCDSGWYDKGKPEKSWPLV
eukprot:TRINITY_DN1359_c0_g1_i1.p1 TRINITY_DN1359_c0_g1~~TRINITY_DN1359_c0_g1_i1.p1  ORF type:complete len:154 (+),score=26.58 TRINITY_DN1359_c0_g1_i1:424-885(+)